MKSFEYTVTDPLGIHARPAGRLVQMASRFDSDIMIQSSLRKADAKRIISVMGLAIKQGETIVISCVGQDEDEAQKELLNFVQNNL